ncbi:hypothetical protein SRB5_24110 [Streptomyces sp. RB5]|uniref:DUF6286 domain-containing protein n=1 Tax=Streptomyces smaragdinus TaxID=2585196 RepID=A0A7K0CFP0_9ACTN|nr:DUF6286 domain-containing protein [Streptomyces smaragdinus]MQY12278.1 hypothetical protein [Streptomyces smaragdinus]
MSDDTGTLLGEQRTAASGFSPGEGEGGDWRFWSVRRVPAALTAVAVALGAGVLLYDIVSVRAERPAMAWRRRLAAELAARPPDDPWVLLAASLVLLLGVGLIVLAATPGLRTLLPMSGASGELRAGLERSAAAVVLRDRAMQISGVQSVRVDVGRRSVAARAEAHFRALDDVRTDLEAVLGVGIGELGLTRRPALSVSVRRPPSKG